MNLDEKMPWSKKALRRLGEALKESAETSEDLVPGNYPPYDDVMQWHTDLAAEVREIVASTPWKTFDLDASSVTARAKTIDTLVQKLIRESTLKLDNVGDLAGVRVDADFTLDVQLAIAEEVAKHFGDRAFVKDLRDGQHSGYRAVHLRLQLPAGNVEVQFRTFAQSLWANTFERVADRFGRTIRYGGEAESLAGQKLVAQLLEVSSSIAEFERAEQQLAQQRLAVAKIKLAVAKIKPDTHPSEVQAELKSVSEQLDRFEAKLGEGREKYRSPVRFGFE